MKNFKLKKFFSIKTRITLSIVLFVLVTVGIIFFVSYANLKKTNRENLNIRILNRVAIASLQINGDEHSLLKVRSDEDTQSYKDIKQVLQKIRDISTDIVFIYTLRENQNNEIEFIVDAEENEDNISHLGDVYDDSNIFLKDNFLSINKPVVEPYFTTDKWGTWLSGYAPFYDKNGKREGVLGIDIKASDVISSERKVLFNYILYFVISGLFAILLGVFLSKKIIKSITSLTEFIKKSNHKDIKILNNENDEIGELKNVLKNKFEEVSIIQKNTDDDILDKNKTLEKMNKLMVGRELEMIKLKKEIIELKNK